MALCGRLGAIVIGSNKDTKASVTADDLGVGGALCVLMKDALMPTIMQVSVREFTQNIATCYFHSTLLQYGSLLIYLLLFFHII